MGNDTLRAPAKGMVEDPANDTGVARAKRREDRKAQKAQLRTTLRTEGLVAAVKLFLSGEPLSPASEECEDCVALNRRDPVAA